MSAEGVTFIVAALGSLLLTLGLGLRLEPDVTLYTSGLGLFPSPLGTLLGLTGVVGVAVVHALGVGAIFAGLVVLRPPLRSLLAALPVLILLYPLSVDAAAAVLFVAGVYVAAGRYPALSCGAGLLHVSLLPPLVLYLVGRSRAYALVAGAAAVAGLGLVLATPYSWGLSGSYGLWLEAAAIAWVVVLLALGPMLAAGVVPGGGELLLVLGVGAAAFYAARSDFSYGAAPLVALAGTARYALPVVLVGLLAAAGYRLPVLDGRTRRPTTVAEGGTNVRKRLFVLTGLLVVGALLVVPAAFAQSVPAVPVDSYGDALLSSLATAIGAIFPYAAAITAFAIAVGMVKRWLGHRKATRV